jgi:hypothetical protein
LINYIPLYLNNRHMEKELLYIRYRRCSGRVTVVGDSMDNDAREVY